LSRGRNGIGGLPGESLLAEEEPSEEPRKCSESAETAHEWTDSSKRRACRRSQVPEKHKRIIAVLQLGPSTVTVVTGPGQVPKPQGRSAKSLNKIDIC
jgi:hypothetical protein